jgi:hypothetical protein
MIIADLKKKENIVEYIIYIKQIEDIIRANDFNINKIEEIIINQYKVDKTTKNKIKNWYSDLIISMKQECIEKTGDLKLITDIENDLDAIHKKLLFDKNEYKHTELYRWAKPNIAEFKDLSKSKSDNEIHISIDALYSLFLLRLQKKEISVDTLAAMQTFSNLLAHIALKYNEIKNNT